MKGAAKSTAKSAASGARAHLYYDIRAERPGTDVQPIQEYRGIGPAAFRDEIAPLGKPALLRGVAADWPFVRAASQSAQSAAAYLKRFASTTPFDVFVGAPEIQGRLFYKDNMQAFNFERRPMLLGDALDQILAVADQAARPTIYVQSAPAQELVPGLAGENAMPLLGPEVAPRIWIGAPVTVAAHCDLAENIACVAAGRRRVTLFPPEQLPNLYVGPVDFSPAGTPISMVDVEKPDLNRYPNFAEALAAAQQAELGPGDAIYIPYFWWHSIRSIEPFNVLVNYWWNSARSWLRSPYDSLLHSVLALRDLPDEQRAAWRTMYDYFVFKTAGEPLSHLAPEHRGALAPLTPERVKRLRMILARALGA